MKLADLAQLLGAEFVTGAEYADREVTRAFAADLLSDVLAMVQEEGVLLITGMTTPQVVRVAEVMNMGAVLFVRGKYPTGATVEYAAGAGIPLLAASGDMYETCGVLYQAGLLPARRKGFRLDRPASPSRPPA
ncbi:MAG: DRTGG domain-containing protein [Candidatus Bipolaricaulota bacterium]|nr:DRTGG domain-containing protein [Candidatus Bipolaricaulota bacterium]